MKDKIKADSVAALKSHDNVRVGVLRYLISLIDKKELQLPPGQMTETVEVSVLRKELKDKQEAREMFVKGNRDDLVKEVDYEIAVVSEYLPAEMPEAELEKIVDEAVAGAGGNFGAAMKDAMGKVAGRVGGDKISLLIKQKLA
jgi:uncharacterized protein YqeY